MLHGLLNINKPAGLTSRDVVDVVARASRTKRCGHAGTLDPMATGVLVVCLGWCTRLVPFIQEQKKGYAATFLLGQSSDTDDITGQVTEVSVAAPPSRDAIERLLPRFRGVIEQVPPSYSAVHVGGQRAHHLARKGVPLALRPRPVVVHRLELVNYAWPELQLEVECGSGTYVRSIGRDLGDLLGCGGVMSALTRTYVSPFPISDAIPLHGVNRHSVRDRLLKPLTAVASLPRYVCTPDEMVFIGRGRPIEWRGPPPAEAISSLALVDSEENLLALARYDSEPSRLQPEHVFVRSS